ncbi:hypothetical protein ES703_11206 [subsurface metagenome]
MRRTKLTTKHKLLIMLIPPGKSKDPKMVACWNQDFVRGFKAIWNEEISNRQITRITTQLVNDKIIERCIFASFRKEESPFCQQNVYEIIDAEKGFADLFDTPGKKREGSGPVAREKHETGY